MHVWTCLSCSSQACVSSCLQVEEKKASGHVKRKMKLRDASRKLDQHLDDQFATGRLFACISSRPGQCGRCDGYILEGK